MSRFRSLIPARTALFALLATGSQALAGEAPSGAASPPPPAHGEGLIQALGFVTPKALSPWRMALHADIAVKAVIAILAIASVATWTIWLAKSLELLAARRRARADIGKLAQCADLAAVRTAFQTGRSPIAGLALCTIQEQRDSRGLPDGGLKERFLLAAGRLQARESRKIQKGAGLLATIGATAPFVGLFGTVWGVMDSFVGISRTQATNLAVVAPGIAEALLATAMGLFAAIPAVVIYNIFARSIGAYREQLKDAAAILQAILSRDLDRARVGVEGGAQSEAGGNS